MIRFGTTLSRRAVPVRRPAVNSIPARPFAAAGTGRGPVSWAGLVVSGAVACAVVAYYNVEKDRLQTLVMTKQKTTGKPSLGGPWSLVDMNGKPVTDADYRGKYVLFYYGFTRCPDICPSELVKVGAVLDLLGPEIAGKSLETLFISVDPQRDTLSQLREYARDFHPTIQYLTGTKEQIAVATKAWRVYFVKANENENDDEDYLVDHSTVLYLMGPTGEFEEFFTSSVNAPEIAKKIRAHVNQETSSDGEIGPAEVLQATLKKLGKLLRST